MEITVHISGMHCAGCVRRLTEAFRAVPGVVSAHVTLEPPEAHITTESRVSIGALGDAARSVGAYTVSEAEHGADSVPGHADHTTDTERPESLYPLFLIVGFIAGTTILATFVRGDGSWHSAMHDFMAGFFLVFSFFKLLDLRGFVDAYTTYDILARAWRPWAWAYPFVELALGIAYLVRWNLVVASSVTVVLMVIGSVGVLRALMRKTRIRCACLGTALNLPMTTVTLVEDLAMAGMAGASLLWPG